MFDVEGEGLGSLEADAFGEALVEIEAVVEVGVFGQADVGRPGRGHDVGEAGAGDEANPITPGDEVSSDREQLGDVAVDGNGGDDDRRHARASLGLAEVYDDDVVFITMASRSIGGSSGDRSRAPRRYRSELRSRQAAETRVRVIAAAAELFGGLGYSRTTLAKIAEEAEVSIETVQAQGSKAELMVAATEFAAVGVTGDQSILDLDLGRAFVAITDRDEAIDFIVDQQTAIHERSASMVRALYGAAANDPALDRYLGDLLAGVGRQIRRVLEVCASRGWLRDDLAFDDLVATAVVVASIDTYVRLVDREGWSVDAFRAWFRRVLEETVFTG